MSKTAVYLRVSTDDQESGIKSQETAIKEYLKGHGMQGATWYRDRISGAKSRRPGLDRLQKDIFNGRVDTVVVWALDRLTRKGIADGLNLMGKWLDKGVRVVSISQQFDFYGEQGELLASVFFAIAKMQRLALIEATKRGLRDARKRGVVLGKRRSLFAKDIVPLLERFDGNMSRVARELGKSRQAIYTALKREQGHVKSA